MGWRRSDVSRQNIVLNTQATRHQTLFFARRTELFSSSPRRQRHTLRTARQRPSARGDYRTPPARAQGGCIFIPDKSVTIGMVRAAQASPDHGVCGVRGPGLVLTLLAFRVALEAQEPPSVHGCGWDSQFCRHATAQEKASVAPNRPAEQPGQPQPSQPSQPNSARGRGRGRGRGRDAAPGRGRGRGRGLPPLPPPPLPPLPPLPPPHLPPPHLPPPPLPPPPLTFLLLTFDLSACDLSDCGIFTSACRPHELGVLHSIDRGGALGASLRKFALPTPRFGQLAKICTGNLTGSGLRKYALRQNHTIPV